MKNSLLTILAAAMCFAAGPSIAQPATPAPAQSAQVQLTDAEVRKVDKSAGKITLKHGEIKSLDMPPMTMVFGVKDAAMLDQVKAGDKIRFAATSQDGKFTVTEIQAAQ
ncbi:copper-binding protein [Caenimonas sedimenti]|uniref:Copper-binding protein n=1 Tax=Caenimonas sedimenti TaxID=2596921 RepID=A0A562ZJF2_9BURK|nr:copper-binding protein [Caenimonas sedimenti]TWO68702.1 copper-binding protein [Caenimonas sedimenti]